MGEQKRETVTLVTGEHKYQFKILEALHGLGVYHEWLMYLGSNLKSVKEALAGMLEGAESLDVVDLFKRLVSDDDAFILLRELLVKVIGIQKLFELCATFLEGATVDGDTCDVFGMCPLFKRLPHETYTALLLAVAANYPDYFPFVKGQLDTGESRSPQ